MTARRVLIIRSSRFLERAISESRRRWPDAEIRVLYQAGSEPDVEASGLTPDPRLRVQGWLRLSRFALSQPCWRLVSWKADAVVLQWWSTTGKEHAAANRIALLLGRSGYHAVLADGTWVERTVGAHVLASLRRIALRGVGVVLILIIVISSLLAWPAYLLASARAQRPHGSRAA
jgi:hypothetical protein